MPCLLLRLVLRSSVMEQLLVKISGVLEVETLTDEIKKNLKDYIVLVFNLFGMLRFVISETSIGSTCFDCTKS